MPERPDPDRTRSDRALVDRVQKLLGKAAATTNQHEADAFSRKAAELVARHRLDPARLAAPRTAGDLAVRDFELGRGAYVRARLSLLHGIASANDAQVVFTTTPSGMVAHVAGYVADLDVIEVMYASLHAQAAAQMAATRRGTAAATQQYRRSFLFGYAERIGDLLASSRRHVEQAEQAGSGSGSTSALALRERAERVDEFAARSFGRVRKARRAGGAQIGAWQAGVAAADRADVGRARLGGRRAIGPGS